MASISGREGTWLDSQLSFSRPLFVRRRRSSRIYYVKLANYNSLEERQPMKLSIFGQSEMMRSSMQWFSYDA
jgi:hypothetical protein